MKKSKFSNLAFILVAVVTLSLYFNLNKQLSVLKDTNNQLNNLKTSYQYSLYDNLQATLFFHTVWPKALSINPTLKFSIQQSKDNQMYYVFLLLDATSCWDCIEFELNNLEKFKYPVQRGVIAINTTKDLLLNDKRLDRVKQNIFILPDSLLSNNLDKIALQPTYLVFSPQGFLTCYTYPKFDLESFNVLFNRINDEHN